jgi:transposase
VFGVRLPRALTAAFIDKAFRANEGITGLSAMRGPIAAWTAALAAVAAIDAGMRLWPGSRRPATG